MAIQCTPSRPRQQRGATLFVALMLLVVVTLLGLSVAQVTMLQERMANTYQTDMIAFQNAEARLRGAEVALTQPNPLNCSASDNPVDAWVAAGTTNADAFESLTRADQVMGLNGPLPGDPDPLEHGSINCLLFRVAAAASDVADADDPTSTVVVQSVYILEN